MTSSPTAAQIQYDAEKGSKYEATKELPLKEVTKLIRADLKAAVGAGELPRGLTFSLQTDTRGTHAIRVQIHDTPFRILSPRGLGEAQEDGSWMTKEAFTLYRKVEAIASAYNFDHSDIQTDYFHVRYYLTLDFSNVETALERAVRNEIVEADAILADKAHDKAAQWARGILHGNFGGQA